MTRRNGLLLADRVFVTDTLAGLAKTRFVAPRVFTTPPLSPNPISASLRGDVMETLSGKAWRSSKRAASVPIGVGTHCSISPRANGFITVVRRKGGIKSRHKFALQPA